MGSGNNAWTRGHLIGRGAFGEVTSAVQITNPKVFAVKTVALAVAPPLAVESLENEIEILRSLRSPYVVAYLGDDLTREPPLGVCRNLHLEYMPGGAVADLAGKLGEWDVKAYTRCAAHALQYLHSAAGIVHGDVKGRNLLVGDTPGAAKLCDFGSAGRIGGKAIGGTPLWMAPEVARGEIQTPESDVWSLGCMAIEMVTGGQPWGGRVSGDAESVMFRIGYGDEVPEVPAGMSAAGRDFIGRCLRRDAGERWSCEQLLRHPFLADGDSDGVARPSPRCVLDWGGVEFEDDECEEQGEIFGSELGVESARERIRNLVSDLGMMEWGWENDEGWEVIRGRMNGSEGIFRRDSERGSSSEATRGLSCCCWSGCTTGDDGKEWRRGFSFYFIGKLLLLVFLNINSFFSLWTSFWSMDLYVSFEK